MPGEPYPFRLGTTSYIIPDSILPNVRYLADKVKDIELVLFESDDGISNFPDAALIRQMAEFSAQYDLSYTVHLPLDLEFGSPGGGVHPSLEKAERIIHLTKPLEPHAYVAHLDGRKRLEMHDPIEQGQWCQRVVAGLEKFCFLAGSPRLLCLENLEHYPLSFLEPVLFALPVGCCIDVGHLWLENHPTVPFLEKWLHRTRVLHVHGVAGRDHQSLGHVPGAQIDELLRILRREKYRGVLTLEVFGEEELNSSLEAMAHSWNRVCENKE